MSSRDERLQILEMIDSGVISAQEGARLLQSLEGVLDQDEVGEGTFVDEQSLETSALDQIDNSAPPPRDAFGEHSQTKQEFDAHIEKWRRWWMIPLWVGVGILIIGGLLMLWAYQVSGFSFWFGCAWVPFLLGLGVIILAWSTRTSRWLHLRVQQKPGERPQTIALSFPIPIRLTAWLLRMFRNKIPGLGKSGIDELVLAMGSSTNPETPFFIEVDEGEDGERVQIYIG